MAFHTAARAVVTPATDFGRRADRSLAVRAGKYSDVIAISKTSVSEPGAEQLKYYARGVGNAVART